MTENRYDITFAGELAPGTDPAEARRRIQTLFKLSDEAAHRLFGKRPATIKRGVDNATVVRYREAFRKAGAFIRVEPVPTSADLLPAKTTAAPKLVEDEPKPPAAPRPRAAGLQLTPLEDDRPLEAPPVVNARKIDISYLSLVPGNDWTLADCEPPPPLIPVPDISHLRIVDA
jgi:hypothetical protein